LAESLISPVIVAAFDFAFAALAAAAAVPELAPGVVEGLDGVGREGEADGEAEGRATEGQPKGRLGPVEQGLDLVRGHHHPAPRETLLHLAPRQVQLPTPLPTKGHPTSVGSSRDIQGCPTNDRQNKQINMHDSFSRKE
jgi:hypothetical protein